MFTSARTSANLVLALSALVGTAVHANNLNPILGGGLGAMAGAFIGQSVGGRDGAMIGAAVGGVAGVGIASNGIRREPEPVRQVLYEQPYRSAPAYGYQVVERVNYYPVRGYEHHDWDHRGGDHRGWDRRD